MSVTSDGNLRLDNLPSAVPPLFNLSPLVLSRSAGSLLVTSPEFIFDLVTLLYAVNRDSVRVFGGLDKPCLGNSLMSDATSFSSLTLTSSALIQLSSSPWHFNRAEELDTSLCDSCVDITLDS